MPKRERIMLEIARNFAEIADERHQEAVSNLARVLAGTDRASAARQQTEGG